MHQPGIFAWNDRIAGDVFRVNPGTQEELPPKEAAKACLAAAEKMQNSGQVEQAIFLYEKARRNDPGLKSVAHHLAVLYDAQGDSIRSLSEYKKAAESDPKNPGLLSDLGYYYYERGNLPEAERSLRNALTIDPNHAKALSNLGTGSCRAGAIWREFRGILQSGRPRRGPFQPWRAHGETRAL